MKCCIFPAVIPTTPIATLLNMNRDMLAWL